MIKAWRPTKAQTTPLISWWRISQLAELVEMKLGEAADGEPQMSKVFPAAGQRKWGAGEALLPEPEAHTSLPGAPDAQDTTAVFKLLTCTGATQHIKGWLFKIFSYLFYELFKHAAFQAFQRHYEVPWLRKPTLCTVLQQSRASCSNKKNAPQLSFQFGLFF